MIAAALDPGPLRRPRRAAPALWEWAVLVEILLLAAWLRYLWTGFSLDDAYITFTYARSLAEGNGFQFAGEKVLGTTTPLYALLLGAAGAAGAPIAGAARVIGILGAVAAGVCLFLLVRESLGPAAGLAAAALLAVNPRHAAVSASGMETALYTAVVLAAFCTWNGRRPVITALLAAAACLLRPDGVLLAAVLAGAQFRERRGSFVWPTLAFAAPLLGWALYATHEFQSPIPTSVSAKLAYPEYGAFTPWTAFGFLGPELAPLVAALAAVGVLHAWLRARGLLPLAIWTLLYLAAFLRAPNFPWYYVPPAAGLMVLALAGIAGLGALLPGRRSRAAAAGSGRGAAGLLALGGASAALLVWTVYDWGRHSHFVYRSYGPEVTAAYRAMGLWLRDHTEAHAVVAAPEVGYVGYYSGRKVLDLAGLCSPQVIPYLPERRYLDIVRDFRPDYVALTTEENRPIHNVIAAAPWFRRHFRQRAAIPYRGGRKYVIYQLMDGGGGRLAAEGRGRGRAGAGGGTRRE